MQSFQFSRRDFMKLGALFAAGMHSLGQDSSEIFAAGLEKLVTTTRVIWIQGQSCTGDSVSLLNSINPGPVDLLTQYMSLVSHQTLGSAQGHVYMDVLKKAEEAGEYILAIEGSIPMGMPEACVIGGETLESILKRLIPKAKAVVAIGTCAAFGGIPAADGNPTGSASVSKFMTEHHFPVSNRLINLPSCPTHPKSMVGTFAYVAAKGYPEVDPKLLVPKMFYGSSTHDECPRYHYYERKIFAKYLGDSHGCLFKLGCLGPVSYTQCPHRQWNSGANWCIRASAPCIGCSSPVFAKKKDFPFYRKSEALMFNQTSKV